MGCDSRVERLRRLADCANEQGCPELAGELQRLAALTDATLLELACCSRCGREAALGARLRVVFADSSEHASAGCSGWRGALCDGCAEELREWHGALGGGLVLEGAPWPQISDSGRLSVRE